MPTKDKTTNTNIVRLDRRSKVARRGKQAAASIQAAENTVVAYELRKRGKSYREIAHELGVDIKTAFGYVDGVLAETASLATEDRERVRALEVARLDAMLEGVYERAAAGNDKAIETVVKLMDRRARYLGIDAPSRQEITGASGGPIEVSLDARAALAARLGITLEEDE